MLFRYGDRIAMVCMQHWQYSSELRLLEHHDSLRVIFMCESS